MSAVETNMPRGISAGRPLTCRSCSTNITSSRYLVSRAYRGFEGRAALFRQVSADTTTRDAPAIQLMASGAYRVRNLRCRTCTTYLGFEIVAALEKEERWKEGRCLLEMERVGEPEPEDPAREPAQKKEKEKLKVGWRQSLAAMERRRSRRLPPPPTPNPTQLVGYAY